MYDDKEGIVVHEGPNPRVFMDVTIGGTPAGRIAMELYADTVPKTAEVSACFSWVGGWVDEEGGLWAEGLTNQ